MLNNTKESNSNKSIEYIRNRINEIPADKLAGKLQLTLKKSGDSLKGNCPSGHTSQSEQCFSINNKKKLWKCFQCDIGGDYIELIKTTKKINFIEAIQWVAKEFNIDVKLDLSSYIPYELTPEEKEAQRIADTRAILYESAFEYMHNLLFEPIGAEALRYLTVNRKYDIEVLRNSEFCFFPGESKIREHLFSEFPDGLKDIPKLPLSGAYGDNFQVALPYRNAKGKITGFIKRSIQPNGASGYQKDGSPFTNQRYDSTFGLNKHDLFNLYNCRDQETLLIVEGYPDAVYFHTAGINNITAVGQGKLSKSHIEGLKYNKIKNVIISFDNDKVGPTNTGDAVKLILEATDIVPFVLDPSKLNPNKDPDEFVRANGVAAFQSLINEVEKGLCWLGNRISAEYDGKSELSKQSVKNKLLELAILAKVPEDRSFIKTLLIETLHLQKADVNSLISAAEKRERINKYQKIKYEKENSDKRYFPFIEISTSSYSYFDYQNESVHLGVPKEILSNILASAQQLSPDIFPVLKADFDVSMNERIDMEKEKFNFFKPTEYLLLSKTNNFINPFIEFPHIYQLLINLIPKYKERKRYLNWLAGILQTRQKQGTAWVFKGVQGAGKNLMLDSILKPMFGNDQVNIVDDYQLKSEFNPWMQNTMIIAFNEVAHDNDTRNSIKSRIKSIITDPEVTINEKNVKSYKITNYVNCLFFSNERVPIFIEDQDRRLNVVTTGGKLRAFEWFNKDPKGFIKWLGDEVPKFAQFLMNCRYDSNLAETVIDNEDKQAVVAVGMNRFEEFAHHLKLNDVEWFQENSRPNIYYNRESITELKGKIKKELALTVFKEIYGMDNITKVELGKKLKLYGINADRSRKEHDTNWYYTW